MNWLQQAREAKNLNQTKLADKTTTSRSRICKIEKGTALPTRAQGEAIAKELGLAGVPCSEDLVSERQIQNLPKHRPYELEPQNQERWKVALKAWAVRILRLQPDPRTLSLMRILIRVDSAIEAFFWILTAAAGTKFVLAIPHAMGFRLQPIVDSQGL
ncbi:hypothetical protein ABS71_02610, partial [bacterium SCN 62-11]